MDTSELVALIKSEIRASVAEGMQEHRVQDHDPVWTELKLLRTSLNFYQGALWAVAGFTGLSLTALGLAIAYFQGAPK